MGAREKQKGQNEQEMNKMKTNPPNPGLNHGILVYNLVMVMTDSCLRSLDRYHRWW